jgi:tryptophan synthase beta chain
MHTLGHSFVPPPIHAGGLRYHGDAPLLSLLVSQKVIEPRAYHQNVVFEGAMTWAQSQGQLCAPETAHALRAAIDEALKCKETGEEKCILIGYSGHGFFDLSSYEKFFEKQLEDYEYPQEKIDEALKSVPVIEDAPGA